MKFEKLGEIGEHLVKFEKLGEIGENLVKFEKVGEHLVKLGNFVNTW